MEFLKSCFYWVSSLVSTNAKFSSTGSLLPSEQHVQVSLDRVQKRLVIIGDIHGCLDELKTLLEKIKFDATTTTLVSVGDMIVKGPNSVEVVRFVRSLPQGSFLAVRGNHEDNVLLARFKPEGKYGRKEEFKFAKNFNDDELEWLRQLPVSITFPELGLSVVHAGVDPTKVKTPIKNQDFSDLIRIRCVDREGNTSKKDPDEGKRQSWASMYQGPPLIVFGHDAKRKLQIHPWARGLDTGCVYGGALTALVIGDTRDVHGWIEGAEIVSVPAARVYLQKDDD